METINNMIKPANIIINPSNHLESSKSKATEYFHETNPNMFITTCTLTIKVKHDLNSACPVSPETRQSRPTKPKHEAHALEQNDRTDKPQA